MSRYPSLARLLRPHLLPAYDACFWLVTRHTGHRGSGRTKTLAAAFLREVCTGNSARLWDHAAPSDKLDGLRQEIDLMASELGLTVNIDRGGVLRSVTSDNGRPPALVLQEDHVLVTREKLRSAAVEMTALGVEEKDVLAFVSRAIREKVVEEVHGL